MGLTWKRFAIKITTPQIQQFTFHRIRRNYMGNVLQSVLFHQFYNMKISQLPKTEGGRDEEGEEDHAKQWRIG